MKQKTGDKATLSWLFAVSKGKKRYVALLTLVQVLLGGSSTGYALFMSGLVNGAVARDEKRFLTYALLLVGLVVFQFIMRTIFRYLDEYCRASLENAMKRRLFEDLLTRDYATVTATHSGEWLNRMTSDARIVSDGLTHIIPGFSGTAVRMIAAVSLLIAIIPAFALVVLVGGGFIILMTWVLRRMMKRLHRKVQESDGALRVFLSERLGSLMILRAFGQEQAALSQADGLMHDHQTARMKKNRISSFFHNGFAVAMNCVYVLGAVYCGYGILNGIMSYGTFTAVLQLVSQTNAPIANISGYFPQYSATIASAERLMAASDFPEEASEPVRENIPEYYRDSFRCMGLRDAAFTYLPVGDAEGGKEGRRQVLKDLNLEINKGEYVAFCGPSGCGKSTVLKLLMCMYHLDGGQRYLVGREGETPLTAGWRELFSYVPQGNQLMSGTIRQVVTFADEANMQREADIRRALTIACADQFISELPEGLDTLLGERGAGLSEGQMQRIAIARAIFSDRPILLLDEATSALDEETEAKLLDNLRSMTDKTVIIVTHRPAALDITDKIIHFEPNEE